MPCQIRTYANTDILVGLHGAGLTNIVFMPPNSLIVELAAQFDGRMQPLCGYHGPLSGNLPYRFYGINSIHLSYYIMSYHTKSIHKSSNVIRYHIILFHIHIIIYH